jgi:hypothetical protein
MESEHINIKQFIDKNAAFASSVTVNWCGVNFTIPKDENSTTPDGIGPSFFGSSGRRVLLRQRTIICWEPNCSWE